MTPAVLHPAILDAPIVVWSLVLIGWTTFAIGLAHWLRRIDL